MKEIAPPQKLLDGDFLRRAYAAYFREGESNGYTMDQPAQGSSGVESYDGKYYVVLRNVRGVLKVYRVLNNNALKGLRRYPKVFDE